MKIHEAFDHIKTMLGITTTVSAMAVSMGSMYIWTEMDALEVLVVAGIIAAAADLLVMAAVDGMYSMLEDDVKRMDRPRRKRAD